MPWSNPAIGSLPNGGHYGAPRGTGLHQGQDISCPIGSPVHAANDGVVARTQWGGGLAGRTGNGIVLAHAGNLWTYYGHLNGYGVTEGSVVRAGEVIAPSGATGNVTGPHLHFEVITALSGSSASTTNPVPFMSARGVTLGSTPPVVPSPIREGVPEVLVVKRGSSQYYVIAGDRMVRISADAASLLHAAGVPSTGLPTADVDTLIATLVSEK